MRKNGFLLIIFFLAAIMLQDHQADAQSNDSIEIQRLYNGRAWKNLYYRIKGDQFLFNPEFISGSVTIDDQEYKSLRLRYDIYNDEIITVNDHSILIQLNKEMVDFFTLDYNGRHYSYKRIDADSTSSMRGFVNVLYEGRSALYVKNIKEILLLAVDNKYDMFNQVNRIYFVKDGTTYRINSKLEFMRLVRDKKHEIHSFIRENKIKVTKKDPDSFRPVIEFYDKIRL